MIYLLDTNVISEGWRPKPDPVIERWVEENDWFLPVPVIAELQQGAEEAPSAARKAHVNGRLDALLHENPLLVVAWDAETSRTWGRLRYSKEVKAKPQALWDSLIEAMAVRHSATVVTGNTDDFRHAKTLNPWQA